MFRKVIALLVIISVCVQCKYKEKPEFIKVEKIKVENYKKGDVTISADVFFKNPNDYGGKLITENIDVYLNDIQIGKVNTEEFNVPAKDTFAIPLTATFDLMKQVRNNSEALGGNILNLILKKEFKLSFKGPIQFSKGPFNYTYDLDQTNTVSF